MRLFEVVILKITCKLGANNFTFIRVRLGQVRLGYVMEILMLFAPQINIIFAIRTSNNPIINQIYAWERWRTSAWYLPKIYAWERWRTSAWYLLGKLRLSRTGSKCEQSTFKCNICSNFTNRTSDNNNRPENHDQTIHRVPVSRLLMVLRLYGSG